MRMPETTGEVLTTYIVNGNKKKEDLFRPRHGMTMTDMGIGTVHGMNI